MPPWWFIFWPITWNLKSIHKKSRFESIRFESFSSLIRALNTSFFVYLTQVSYFNLSLKLSCNLSDFMFFPQNSLMSVPQSIPCSDNCVVNCWCALKWSSVQNSVSEYGNAQNAPSHSTGSTHARSTHLNRGMLLTVDPGCTAAVHAHSTYSAATSVTAAGVKMPTRA